MRLKLDHLQNIVKSAVAEKKATDTLRTEVTRALGPIIDTSVHLDELAASVNDRLDVLDRTGRSAKFKTSVVAKFSNHSSPEVRKMAARLLPEGMARRFLKDADYGVRMIAKNRFGTSKTQHLNESFLKITGDDAVDNINGDKRLGDDSKTDFDTLDLSDTWYKTIAYNLYRDYQGANMLDLNWEERAVNAWCEHNKATNGSNIDKKKLYDALQDIIKSREDGVMDMQHVSIHDVHLTEQYHVVVGPDGTYAVEDELGNQVDAGFSSEEEAQEAALDYEDELNRHFDARDMEDFALPYDSDDEEPYDLPSNDWKGGLGEIAINLERQARIEEGRETIKESRKFQEELEAVDPVRKIVESNLSHSDIVDKVRELFNIRESTLPPSIKKFVIGEGIRTTHVPQKATIPGGTLRQIDEAALDMFCEAWNSRQAMIGEPLKIHWYPHPMNADAIGFEVKLQ